MWVLGPLRVGVQELRVSKLRVHQQLSSSDHVGFDPLILTEREHATVMGTLEVQVRLRISGLRLRASDSRLRY